MSIALYQIRLWWEGDRGEARYYGAIRRLTSAPPIGQRIHRIDFAPEVFCRVIQPYASGPRDMTRDEERVVMGWLQELG